jgi:hypothetical protein
MKRILLPLLLTGVFFAACGSTPGSGDTRGYRPAFMVGDKVSVTGGNYAQQSGTVIAVNMDENLYKIRFADREDPVVIRSNYLRKTNDSPPVVRPSVPVVTPVAAPVVKNYTPNILSVPVSSGNARLAVLPIVGLDEYTGETIAWHLANQDTIHTNFNVVPITPGIRKNVLTEQSYDSFFNAGEDVRADYILASFARGVGCEKIFFTIVMDVHTKQQLAGDYRKYDDVQQLPQFFPQMTRKIMAIIAQKQESVPRLSVELMAVPPRGIDKNDAIILTQLLAIQMANTNAYSVFPRTENIDAAVLEYETQRTTAKKVFVDKNDVTPSEFVLSSKVAIFDSKNEILAEIISINNDVLKKGAHISFDIIENTPDLLGKLSVQLTGISPRNM